MLSSPKNMTDTAPKPLTSTYAEMLATSNPARKRVLFLGYVGVVVLGMVCLLLAQYSSPTVLSDHPMLKAYVDFMAQYFGSINVLSQGALYPEVSQLVMAVAWSVAVVPFMAFLTETILFGLIWDYQGTKVYYRKRYNIVIESKGTFFELLATPVFLALIVAVILSDLGLVHFLSNVRGVGWERPLTTTAFMDRFVMYMYTSRLGLAMGAWAITYVVVLYPFFLLYVSVFAVPIWLRNRHHRFTRKHAE